MSNFLAIAAVTAALRARVLDAVRPGMDGRDVRVTTLRPGAAQEPRDGPRVNVFLLRTTPSAGLQGIDLPTRAPDGTLTARPTLPVGLQYLLTFTGDDARLEPQRLLGLTLASLHAQPLLPRGFVERVLRTAAQPGDLYEFLRGSDLAQQPDVVRLVTLPMDLEHLSKLWSVFFQTPYQLSVLCEAGPVLLDGPGVPREAAPVRDPRVGVGAMPAGGVT